MCFVYGAEPPLYLFSLEHCLPISVHHYLMLACVSIWANSTKKVNNSCNVLGIKFQLTVEFTRMLILTFACASDEKKKFKHFSPCDRCSADWCDNRPNFRTGLKLRVRFS
uniref:Uncharacterized protein n=1 Tax=Cacopsylla melanoneura TaxID=428564 RepID=A0A8D8M4P3_9HEMI